VSGLSLSGELSCVGAQRAPCRGRGRRAPRRAWPWGAGRARRTTCTWPCCGPPRAGKVAGPRAGVGGHGVGRRLAAWGGVPGGCGADPRVGEVSPGRLWGSDVGQCLGGVSGADPHAGAVSMGGLWGRPPRWGGVWGGLWGRPPCWGGVPGQVMGQTPTLGRCLWGSVGQTPMLGRCPRGAMGQTPTLGRCPGGLWG